MLNFDLDKHDISRLHFIGIGGISMSAIAEVLLEFGYRVSGSDMSSSKITHKLMEKGATVHIGHHKDHVPPCDMVVYTAAIKEDNPEFVRAKELNIPMIDRAQMLGLLMKKFNNSIAISGTHGKTTTTSMVSLILEYSGFDPTIMVGGELDEISGNVKIGNSDYFVTEACEYVESFLKFFPKFGIILNVEEDHLDYFKDIHHIISAFTKFAQLIPSDGYLIASKDDKHIQSILPHVHCNVITFGMDTTCDYYGTNIIFNDLGLPSFDVFHQNQKLGSFHLKIPGNHNVYNALAAIACCHTLGVPIEKIIHHLQNFRGTHRRFEFMGTPNHITVVDDYAHHPTEIKATLEAASNVPHNRLWAIFQPHTYTRTKSLLHDFATSFYAADKIIITDIYAAREKDLGEIHSSDLVKAIASNSKDVVYIKDFDEIVSYVSEKAQPNDLVLTMGAGNIYSVGEMLVNSLKKD